MGFIIAKFYDTISHHKRGAELNLTVEIRMERLRRAIVENQKVP